MEYPGLVLPLPTVVCELKLGQPTGSEAFWFGLVWFWGGVFCLVLGLFSEENISIFTCTCLFWVPTQRWKVNISGGLVRCLPSVMES